MTGVLAAQTGRALAIVELGDDPPPRPPTFNEEEGSTDFGILAEDTPKDGCR